MVNGCSCNVIVSKWIVILEIMKMKTRNGEEICIYVQSLLKGRAYAAFGLSLCQIVS